MVFFFRNRISKGYYFWKKRQHKRFSKQKQQQEKQQLYQQWNGIVKSISSLLIENNYYFLLETWTLSPKTKEKKYTQLYVETCARQYPTNNEESDPRPNATIMKKFTKNIGRSLLGMTLKELDPTTKAAEQPSKTDLTSKASQTARSIPSKDWKTMKRTLKEWTPPMKIFRNNPIEPPKVTNTRNNSYLREVDPRRSSSPQECLNGNAARKCLRRRMTKKKLLEPQRI
ncbi:hypothetical protein C2G38_2210980 [Gigaspora rosea]|uniref:Uncharacterized protein n=1 Tax=Gigaspora rosea TaxID=44941 RepID=A0A397UIU1_9GLOM|nr:hypothetical protein C2G38_2210980 [Gigaspora rosea]